MLALIVSSLAIVLINITIINEVISRILLLIKIMKIN